MTATEDGLVEVRLLRFPLDVQARAEEHHEELLREFSHIAHSDADTTERIPDRLLALVARLRSQYQPFAAPAREEMHAARAARRSHIDVSYVVPPAVKEVAQHLAAELDEADRFCRSGELLTLATPPELVRFRRWFLGEFARQIDGAPPKPWDDHAGD